MTSLRNQGSVSFLIPSQAGRLAPETAGSLSLLQRPIGFSQGWSLGRERAQCWLRLGDLVRGRGGVSTQMLGGRGGLPCLEHSQSAKGERWKLSLLGKKTY